ncbi:hypothetical protein GCM10010123_13770 [Pilimelia anulata]|uniref:Uncharacterized protein n=1 Tax=Pilimelia anulata TaxID=53371 RepID=A0A8J3B8K2_9ACTN|nr:hypothetical protein [Pilimelia anulata]GGJ85320.1 hypothetical protein GCM10010123_13770 [Pilimelia anulata]
MSKDVVAIVIVLAVMGLTWYLGQRAMARAHGGSVPRWLLIALAVILLAGAGIVLAPALARVWTALF